MDRSTRDRRLVAALAGLAFAVAVQVPLLAVGIREGALLPLTALAAAYTAAPLAARAEPVVALAAGLRALGRVLFYVAAYALSFQGIADALRLRAAGAPALAAALPPFLVAAGAVAAGLRRTDVDAHARGEAMLLAATVVAFAAGLALETGNGAAIVANMALAFLAVGRIVRGLSSLARGPFWEGLAVATVLVASRAAEVLRAPWLGAAAALACVAGAAVAGLVFERRRARAPKPARAGAS